MMNNILKQQQNRKSFFYKSQETICSMANTYAAEILLEEAGMVDYDRLRGVRDVYFKTRE